MVILLANPVKNWPILKRIFSMQGECIPGRARRRHHRGVHRCGRLSCVPVRLGARARCSCRCCSAAELLLFGEIASLSHRWQTPLLLLFVLAGGILGFFLEHYNDVRWIAGPARTAAGSAPQQATISEAIDGLEGEQLRAHAMRGASDRDRRVRAAQAARASSRQPWSER